jgi:hypothetical protein
MTAQSPGTRLVIALDQTWQAIQGRHYPDVPPVIITLGSGSMGAGRRLRLGHFAASRWQLGNGPDGQVSELFVGGEGLRRGALEVLGTLLHEAAHGVAHARGITDTSRDGKYHNTKFRALAQDLGLSVEQDKTLGWQTTKVTDATAKIYKAEIKRLTDALVIFRHSEVKGTGTGADRNYIVCECDCGRKIRISKRVYDQGSITCGLCDYGFEPAA